MLAIGAVRIDVRIRSEVHPAARVLADLAGEVFAGDGARRPQRSAAALRKSARHTLDDGTPVHSFSTLIANLSTIVRNTFRTPSVGPDAPTFDVVTTPNERGSATRSS